MDLIQLNVEALIHYENNPRNNDHAVEQMATLIETYGFQVPILAAQDDDGDWHIIDGHLRIKAATSLGLEEVPAVDVTDMSEEARQSLRLAVNKAAELASWDLTKLTQELTIVTAHDDAIIDLLGFDDVPEVIVPSAEPAAPATTRSKSADPSTVKTTGDTVTLSLRMTAAQRDEALKELDKIKDEHGLESRSNAFLRLVFPAPNARKRKRSKT